MGVGEHKPVGVIGVAGDAEFVLVMQPVMTWTYARNPFEIVKVAAERLGRAADHVARRAAHRGLDRTTRLPGTGPSPSAPWPWPPW